MGDPVGMLCVMGRPMRYPMGIIFRRASRKLHVPHEVTNGTTHGITHGTKRDKKLWVLVYLHQLF